jgi:hypothetical protein
MILSALVAASLFHLTQLAALGSINLADSHPALQFGPPTLKTATPFRLEVSSPGTRRRITIGGTDFEAIAHPNRGEYMHWQIRRDDDSWQPCARWSNRSGAICEPGGWNPDSEVIEIGGSYLAREGFVELRVFRGLALDTETDPHRAAQGPTAWSNVLRVPVVVPGPAPRVTALSRKSFPIGGAPSEYWFIIDAAGLDGQPVVVFRGDVVVSPEQVEGHRIQVTVPEVYRLDAPGELPLSVRTDKGGSSPEVYIRFVQPMTMVPARDTDVVTKTKTAAQASPVVPRAGVLIRPSSEACLPGYVWREATRDDHACVTSETRSQTARQNVEAATRRRASDGSTPALCLSGYVWREAVAGDVVCVTPAERAQAAEDNRLGPSRTQRPR